MVSAIRQNNREGAEELLNDIFKQLGTMQPTVDSLQNFFLDLLSTLKRAWIERDIDLNRFFGALRICRKLRNGFKVL